jgi:hypothetical protein
MKHDATLTHTVCPLGMLMAVWEAACDYPEKKWANSQRCEVFDLIRQMASRLPPPETNAGWDCLLSVRELYDKDADGIMKDDAHAPEVRARLELMLDERAWVADQRAKIAAEHPAAAQPFSAVARASFRARL